MDAIKFLKEKNRMTKDCEISCSRECRLSYENNGFNLGCGEFISSHPETAVEIVETWSKENPVRSYYDVMIEMFPTIDLNHVGCIDHFVGIHITCTGGDCADCWKAHEYVKPTTK